MKVKPWHWLAAGAAAFVLLKDDLTRVLSPSTTMTLRAGRTYLLSGPAVGNFNPLPSGGMRTALVTPASDQVIQFNVTTMTDAFGVTFKVQGVSG